MLQSNVNVRHTVVNMSLYLRRTFHQLRRSSTKSFSFPEEPLGRSVAERGGFYAPSLASTLNSRYTIIGKLGWGLHSNVWLARDMRQQDSRHVAVKILSAHATRVQGDFMNELAILQRINVTAKTHPGQKHVSAMLDNFTITDHHGSHLCLVFEVLGEGVIYELGEKLPVSLVKIITRQILLALDLLHRECRIIHTDLQPRNLLITLPNAENAIQRYLAERVDSPQTPSVVSDSSVPIVLSRPIDPFTYDEISSIETRLIDFGTAEMVDGPHAPMIQPYALRAPEVILGNTWDTSADIWSLGCLLFEFLTGNRLFNPRGGANYTIEAYHLAVMPLVLPGEEFDPEYFRSGNYFKNYFSPDDRLWVQVRAADTLEKSLDIFHVFNNDAEKALGTEFLRLMLRLKPSDRLSAAELLEHEWLK